MSKLRTIDNELRKCEAELANLNELRKCEAELSFPWPEWRQRLQAVNEYVNQHISQLKTYSGTRGGGPACIIKNKTEQEAVITFDPNGWLLLMVSGQSYQVSTIEEIDKKFSELKFIEPQAAEMPGEYKCIRAQLTFPPETHEYHCRG